MHLRKWVTEEEDDAQRVIASRSEAISPPLSEAAKGVKVVNGVKQAEAAA